MKLSGRKFIFFILYVDNILLATNSLNLLQETKEFLSKNFKMKDINNASSILDINIHRDRSKRILGSTQWTYINKVLKRFHMQNRSTTPSPIIKGDKLSQSQCPQNDIKRQQMSHIPYASAVGSLMYAQTCMWPNICFTVGMHGRYQSNPSIGHWKGTKKVIRYLQGTEDLMLTYRHIDHLEVIR